MLRLKLPQYIPQRPIKPVEHHGQEMRGDATKISRHCPHIERNRGLLITAHRMNDDDHGNGRPLRVGCHGRHPAKTPLVLITSQGPKSWAAGPKVVSPAPSHKVDPVSWGGRLQSQEGPERLAHQPARRGGGACRSRVAATPVPHLPRCVGEGGVSRVRAKARPPPAAHRAARAHRETVAAATATDRLFGRRSAEGPTASHAARRQRLALDAPPLARAYW